MSAELTETERRGLTSEISVMLVGVVVVVGIAAALAFPLIPEASRLSMLLDGEYALFRLVLIVGIVFAYGYFLFRGRPPLSEFIIRTAGSLAALFLTLLFPWLIQLVDGMMIA